MPTRTTPWPAGAPCWADLVTDDPHAAASFYSHLFGWKVDFGPEEFGGYAVATLNGHPVAGIGPKPPSESLDNAWQTYFASDAVGTTLEKVREAGGEVAYEPMQVGSFGQMAVCTDPTGGSFAVWQAGEHIGFGVTDEPGALCWRDLHTPAFDQARDFYGAVFGWTWTSISDTDALRYATFHVGSPQSPQAGGLLADPSATAARWFTWIAVDDVDGLSAQATSLGATVVHGPEDTPYGRMTSLRGPQGELFGLLDPDQRAAAAPA